MGRNEENVLLQEIEVPAVVQEKADAAFLKIREEGMDSMKRQADKSYRMRNVTGRILAAAACAALVLAVGAAGAARRGAPGTADMAQRGASGEERQQTDPANGHGFSVTAYAAELTMADAGSAGLLLADAGIWEDGYTGMLFSVQGENITSVDISIDRGELYSVTMERMDREAAEDWLAQGAPEEPGQSPDERVIIVPEGEADPEDDGPFLPEAIWRYHCVRGGAEISDVYTGERYYGFCVPDASVSAANQREDASGTSYGMLQVFEGATLRITATYADGSSLTKEYDVAVKKLRQAADGTVTQEEWDGGGEGAFVYGLLLTEHKTQ